MAAPVPPVPGPPRPVSPAGGALCPSPPLAPLAPPLLTAVAQVALSPPPLGFLPFTVPFTPPAAAPALPFLCIRPPGRGLCPCPSLAPALPPPPPMTLPFPCKCPLPPLSVPLPFPCACPPSSQPCLCPSLAPPPPVAACHLPSFAHCRRSVLSAPFWPGLDHWALQLRQPDDRRCALAGRGAGGPWPPFGEGSPVRRGPFWPVRTGWLTWVWPALVLARYLASSVLSFEATADPCSWPGEASLASVGPVSRASGNVGAAA